MNDAQKIEALKAALESLIDLLIEDSDDLPQVAEAIELVDSL